jgi:GAF domain-containing protein
VQDVSTAESLDAIITIVTHAARTGTGADGVSFVLRDGHQCFYVDEDSIAPLWKGRRFPMSECVSGWAMLHRQAVAIPDITLDLRIPQNAYRATFVRSLVMVPIRSQDPLGAIGAYWASTHHVSAEAVHWLQALADATSAGIEAVRAADEVAELRRSASSAPFADGPREMVRMCAWTKRLFHDGQWMSIEAYLRSRYGVTVTHGMSDDALARFKQEIDSVMGVPRPLSKA